MKPWHFGNTSVRSALRLRNGLIALKKSGLEGNIRGREGDENFRRILGDEGVVSLGADATASVGRKWRSAMEKLGFINPNLPAGKAHIQTEIGPADHISDNGRRLIEAQTVNGWHECFLRALSAYYIEEENGALSSPLLSTFRVMLKLLECEGDSKLSMPEMSLVVQCTPPSTNPDTVADNVLKFRNRRNASENKRRFDRDALAEAAERHDLAAGTFKDYGDTNFRYLKATGVICTRGKGIGLVPEKVSLIQQIVANEKRPANDLERYQLQCQGAELPTDDEATARIVLNDLLEMLKAKGEAIDLSACALETSADIAAVRHEIEGKLFHLKELEYAEQQRSCVEEISGFLSLLNSNKRGSMSATLDNGTEIKIPQGEAPAYFEWAVWRAFLAISSMTIKPWEARRFQIDQDFLPVSTAPGRGSDLVIEFADMVIVVEVTLTQSSRQEAAEGEPVRRHVAQILEEKEGSGKQVYGLFIAVNIDTNTANTFRLGDWYKNDDSKLALHIVPLTLGDFKSLLDVAHHEPAQLLPHLRTLFMQCRMDSNLDAPLWKEKISERTQATIQAIANQ